MTSWSGQGQLHLFFFLNLHINSQWNEEFCQDLRDYAEVFIFKFFNKEFSTAVVAQRRVGFGHVENFYIH
jgi:hypothetical protein